MSSTLKAAITRTWDEFSRSDAEILSGLMPWEKAWEVTHLRVRNPASEGDPRVLTLEFSHSTNCPVRGNYAFELMGTNLFGERYLG